MRHKILVLIALCVSSSLGGMEQSGSADTPFCKVDRQLLIAAQCHKPLLLRWSLFWGADPNVRDSMQATPVHYAVFHEDINCMEQLVSKGAQVNVVTAGMISPLHIASSQHDTAHAAEWLINHGAVVDLQDKQGNTPLHGAVGFNKKALIALLVQQGARVDIANKEGKLPEHLNFPAMWQLCYLPFKKAVIEGDTAAVKRFLAQGVRLNYQAPTGGTPVHWVVASLEVRTLLPLLLTHAVDNQRGLLDSKARVLYEILNSKDVAGQTPLHWAAKLGDFNSWKQLLHYGAQLNVQADDGNTPLHALVLSHHQDWENPGQSFHNIYHFFGCPIGAVVELDSEVRQASARIFTFLCCLNRIRRETGLYMPSDVRHKVFRDYLSDDIRLVPLGSFYKKFGPACLVEGTGFRVQRLLSNKYTIDGLAVLPVCNKLHLLIASLTRHSAMLKEVLTLKDGYENELLANRLVTWMQCYQYQDERVKNHAQLLNKK